MVKSDRKYQRHNEKYDEDTFIIRADNQQAKEANKEDNEFRRDDVRENRAHEKAVLALEQRQAVRTVMPDVKRGGDDLRFATCRTTQSQTTTEYSFDLFNICVHEVLHVTRKSRSATKMHKNIQMMNDLLILYFVSFVFFGLLSSLTSRNDRTS
jgi:hypothetical protein